MSAAEAWMRFDLRAFLKFGGLSGAGWLLDLTILTSLVRAGIPALAANFASSSTAALTVFLVSRYLVFRRAEGGLGRRVLVYVLYTLVVITMASLALQGVLWALQRAAEALGIAAGRIWLAVLAKVVVTPPQLMLNFFVARHTAQRQIGGRNG